MFRDSLKDPHKSKISYMDTSLQRALDYFDFTSKRRALLVYFEPNEKLRTPIEVHFLQDFGEEIEKNFAFVGVTAQSQEKELILPYLPRHDVPMVVAFFHNELGKLTAIESLPLTQDNLKNKPLIRAYLKKMSEVADHSTQVFEESHASLQRKITGQVHGNSPTRDDPAQFDPYSDDYEDQLQRHEQNKLKKQASTDRHVKNDQDVAYAETLRKIEEERRKREEEMKEKKKEAESLAVKQREKTEFMAKLSNEQVDPAYRISIAFRFPAGQKIVRDFDRRSKVGYAHMFAGTVENKGFENPTAEFELAAGFPPKVINREETLESVFGESDSEVVHVREV